VSRFRTAGKGNRPRRRKLELTSSSLSSSPCSLPLPEDQYVLNLALHPSDHLADLLLLLYFRTISSPPLRVDVLRKKGIAAAQLDSSLSLEESLAVKQGVRNGTLKILYCAPERLNNEGFIDMIKDTRVSMLAVDESHCVSEVSSEFPLRRDFSLRFQEPDIIFSFDAAVGSFLQTGIPQGFVGRVFLIDLISADETDPSAFFSRSFCRRCQCGGHRLSHRHSYWFVHLSCLDARWTSWADTLISSLPSARTDQVARSICQSFNIDPEHGIFKVS